MRSSFLYLLQATLLILAVFRPNFVGSFTCPPPEGKSEHDNSKCALPGKDAGAPVKIANAPTKKGTNTCLPNLQEVCCDDSIKKNRITGKDFTDHCSGSNGKSAELKVADTKDAPKDPKDTTKTTDPTKTSTDPTKTNTDPNKKGEPKDPKLAKRGF